MSESDNNAIRELIGAYKDHSVTVFGTLPDITIEYGSMYDPPSIDLDGMNKIREAFGAANVRIERGRSESGCESCDHGSVYCIDIIITGATKVPATEPHP